MFDLQESIRRAAKRIGLGRRRRTRADAGRFRIPAEIAAHLRTALGGYQRPAPKALMVGLGDFCRARGLRRPSRATMYSFMARAPSHRYRAAQLPEAVRRALYNLDHDAVVRGPQVAFYAFNYGDVPAWMFAAGLPWLDLYQARRTRGWRPKSRGLLDAVLRARGI